MSSCFHPGRFSPRLTLEVLPPRSALQRPKSCKVTTSAATKRGISQEISRREVVSFRLSFFLVLSWAACEVIGWQLGRSLKRRWRFICRATSPRIVGASRCFKVTQLLLQKDLNTVSYSSVHKAPLKARACILCDMLVLHAVTNYLLQKITLTLTWFA